ncbi:MAG: hypothetical protein GY820_00740 [Gammaproteobacteria bacterium]|nr:hypothetical protein [Gammaproteobacteria bacterium]
MFIEADAGVDGPINFKSVVKDTDPEKTIVMEFKQTVLGGENSAMILNVKNPFGRAVRYRLQLQRPGSDKFYSTSSCPVGAELSAYEMWPYPIFQMIITDIKFIDEGKDDFSCF